MTPGPACGKELLLGKAWSVPVSFWDSFQAGHVSKGVTEAAWAPRAAWNEKPVRGSWPSVIASTVCCATIGKISGFGPSPHKSPHKWGSVRFEKVSKLLKNMARPGGLEL